MEGGYFSWLPPPTALLQTPTPVPSVHMKPRWPPVTLKLDDLTGKKGTVNSVTHFMHRVLNRAPVNNFSEIKLDQVTRC